MNKQDKVDWNFHINFSPLYFVFVVMVLFAVTIYLYVNVSWDQVLYSLETTPIKLAQDEPL